jgi:hypothetical protein
MATVHSTVVVALLLVIGGFGWILSLATLNTAFQTMLPRWARARGMAFYLVVFQGGNAIGSAVFGVVAAGGLDRGMWIAAVGLALGPLLALWRRMPTIAPPELAPAAGWPPPPVLADDLAPTGPVMVSLEYRAAPGKADDLLRALGQLRRSRRRTGAVSWRAWRDAADPDLLLEEFVVGSWEEHERQHARLSERDLQRAELAAGLTVDGSPRVRHWTGGGIQRRTAPDPGSLADG